MPVIVTADDGSQSSTQHAVKCLYCDALDSEHATSHKEDVTLEKVDPTCTEPGLTEGKKCSDCGYIVTPQTEIEALGHNFGGPEIVTTATDGEDLTMDNTKVVRKCSRGGCDEEQEVTLVSVTKVEEKHEDATCEADGKDVYTIKVSYDNRTVDLSYTVVLSKLGHNIVPVEAKEATCFEDGYKACFKCDREECDKYFREATEEELQTPEELVEGKYKEVSGGLEDPELKLDKTNKHIWSNPDVKEWKDDETKVVIATNCTTPGCTEKQEKEITYTVKDTATCTEAGETWKEYSYYWDGTTLKDTDTVEDNKVTVATDKVVSSAKGHDLTAKNFVLQTDGKYKSTEQCGTCKQSITVDTIEEALAYDQITVEIANSTELKLDKDLEVPKGAKLVIKGTLDINGNNLLVAGTLDLTNAQEVKNSVEEKGTIQKVNEGIISDAVESKISEITQEATINSDAGENAFSDLKTALTGNASAVNVETNIDLDKGDVIEITSGEKTLNLSDDVVITNSNGTTNGIKVNGDEAKLTIKGGTFKATDRSIANAAPLNVNGKGELILENVKVDNSGTDQYGVTVLGNESKLTMTGGSIVTENRACISTEGVLTSGAKIELTGVTLTCNGSGDEAVAMYLPGKADVKLTGCTITGPTGIEMLRGTLGIDDKTTITGTKQAIVSNEGINFNENRSGAINVGGAVVVAVDENYKGEGSSEEIKVTLASTANISDIIVLESTDTVTDRTVTIVSPEATVKGTKIGKSSSSKITIKSEAPEA